MERVLNNGEYTAAISAYMRFNKDFNEVVETFSNIDKILEFNRNSPGYKYSFYIRLSKRADIVIVINKVYYTGSISETLEFPSGLVGQIAFTTTFVNELRQKRVVIDLTGLYEKGTASIHCAGNADKRIISEAFKDGTFIISAAVVNKNKSLKEILEYEY